MKNLLASPRKMKAKGMTTDDVLDCLQYWINKREAEIKLHKEFLEMFVP